jgi:hypothetical protein
VTKPNNSKWKNVALRLSMEGPTKRTSKQCRDRWVNYLSPKVSQAQRQGKDLARLFQLQAKLGNKWALISRQMPGWGENTLKNTYYSTVRRNIRRFNRNKEFSQSIRGPIDELMKIEEIRKILILKKEASKNLYEKKVLSANALRAMEEFIEYGDEYEEKIEGYSEDLFYSYEKVERIIDEYYK